MQFRPPGSMTNRRKAPPRNGPQRASGAADHPNATNDRYRPQEANNPQVVVGAGGAWKGQASDPGLGPRGGMNTHDAPEVETPVPSGLHCALPATGTLATTLPALFQAVFSFSFTSSCSLRSIIFYFWRFPPCFLLALKSAGCGLHLVRLTRAARYRYPRICLVSHFSSR